MASIGGTTLATPIVVISNSHGLSTGNTVVVAGITSAPEANGTWVITVIDPSQFSLNGSVGVHSSVGQGTWTLSSSPTGTITNATNASPIVVTSVAHGRTTGDTITVSSVGGNTAANGTWIITVLTADTFSLNGSTGNSAYTSGGSFTVLSMSQITSATNASPIVVTSTAHGLSSGNFIRISGVVGNEAANGTWAVTVINANSFSLGGSTGSGPYVSGGAWLSVTAGVITGATNATPIVITSVAHGLVTGDVISVSGIVGTTAANSTDQIVGNPVTVINADSFSLDGSSGNAGYTSGGVFRKIPDVDQAGSPTRFSTITKATGTGLISMSDDASSSFPDQTRLMYSIMSGSTVYETGVGTYDAASNSISRELVASNGSTAAGPLNLPGGDKTVTCSTGPDLPGSGSNSPIVPLFTEAEYAAIERLTNTALNAPNPLDRAAATAELRRMAGDNYVRLVELFRDSRGTGSRGTAVAGPHVVRPATPPPPGGTPRPGGDDTRLRSGGAILDPILLIGLAEVAANALASNPTNFTNQGMLSMQPNAVSDDASRLGMSNIVYFVAAPSWPYAGRALGRIDYPKVTLKTATAQRVGYSDFYFPPPDGSSTGISNGATPIYVRLDGQSPGANALPFRVDSTKLGFTDYVRAGIPADLFIYWPAYRPMTENIRPTPANPQMFFLSWQNPNTRTSNFGFGSQVGHRLNLGNSTYPAITLKMRSEPWNQEASGNRNNDDSMYLYVGTIVPVCDGIACCYPGIRLLINQFNRINYEDSFVDYNRSWLVNPSLAGTTSYERMNPGDNGYSWWHYFVDPVDLNTKHGSPQTLSSVSNPEQRRGRVATIQARGIQAAFTAYGQGKVRAGLFRRGMPNLITNATNASPIVITAAESISNITGRSVQTGDRLTISGVRGNTAANGTWIVTRVSDTSISLQGSTGNAAYTTGGIIDQESFVQTVLYGNDPRRDAFVMDRPFQPLDVDFLFPYVPGLNLLEVKQGFDTDAVAGDATKAYGFWGARAGVKVKNGGITPELFSGEALPDSKTPGQCGLRVRGAC